MKRIHYIFLIATILTVGCTRHSYDPAHPQEDRPIEVGLSDEWSSMTKAVYNSKEDIPDGDGFVVWSLCVTDPEASPQPAPEVIFGNAGTKVYAPSWTYSPTRYWQKGTYEFAAVLPSSILNASYESGKTPSDAPSAPYGRQTESDSGTSITLNFGSAGYNLAEGQDDIMVAFANVDNSNSTMGTVVNGTTQKVSFTFEHQLSMISIAATNVDRSVDITVQEIEIYGPHSTSGTMTFTCSDGAISRSWSYSDVSSDTPYKQFQLSAEQGALSKSVQGSTMNYKPLVSDVLVFPEQCTMTIRVKYIVTMFGVSSDAIYRSVEIPTDWQAGLNYAYKLRISSTDITFTSSILPWDDTSFDDIRHEFN